MYDKELIEEYGEIEFENEQFMIVKDYMRYLETRYGRREFYKNDSNAKPPHLIYVNLNLPFSKFEISSPWT